VLCKNQKYTDINNNTELQVWNWNGNPIAIFNLDQKIDLFVISENERRIYALNTDEGHTDDTDETDQRRFLRICANPSNLRHLRAIIAVLSGLVITAFCLYHQYPVYKAYKQWNANLFKPVGFDKNQSKEGRLYPNPYFSVNDPGQAQNPTHAELKEIPTKTFYLEDFMTEKGKSYEIWVKKD
jgi:hypothetical protein